jgi:GrpB-like predicted nucleotidyltransferase (UPF0157 family)
MPNKAAPAATIARAPNNPVVIVDYNPLWPEQFEALRSRLANVLGRQAIGIEHVGSTGVPGLAAKPIIDVDVLLKSAADLPAVISALASIGYQHRGDLGIPGREAFRAPAGDSPHHLYVCTTGMEYWRHISFRDHLRAHPQDANTYAALKRELALKFGEDREGYNNAKREFVEGILRKSLSGKSLSKLAVSSPDADA